MYEEQKSHFKKYNKMLMSLFIC